jgi:hypothetical protein
LNVGTVSRTLSIRVEPISEIVDHHQRHSRAG